MAAGTAALRDDSGSMATRLRSIVPPDEPARGNDVDDRPAVTAILFTDIEGSSRLWERMPAAMQPALARHDRAARTVVEAHRGTIVKMIGDGMHAVFADPLDALHAALDFQFALDEPSDAGDGVKLHARCGIHLGVVEHRDNDYFGNAVNRAARIMSSAHGGQVLLSQAAVDLVRDRLPPDVTLRDLGAVRLRDLESPERLHQLLHPRLRADFPALRSLASTPNNLPLQLTSFIGREQAIGEVEQLLKRSRLLTLHGPGGIGKTRLSLQLAAHVLDDYPDGVWLVELAGLSDPRLVAQAVASALGVKQPADETIVNAVIAHVQERQLLLVLDNCEHLLDACAELVTRVLQKAPRVRVLASSREGLHVAGETLVEVPPLSVPDASRGPLRIAKLMQCEGARLFIERATAAQAGFVVDERNAPAISSICNRLDGIPMALELAAARVRTLSVEQIAARLGDRFRLLSGGDRSALPRQQTLRALIDWSYELLSAHERTLLARLSVFSGGFTLEAAEAVASGDPIDEPAVLDLVSNLVDKSLVARERAGERYRLLETIKQYAQERLDASGDADAVRSRHLAHYLALAEQARPELVGTDQAVWLKRLDTERENLLAAHAWSEHAENGAELGLRLASALRRYWIIRGLPGIGYRLAVEALNRRDAQAHTYARCQGLFDAGQLCSWMGRYREAQGHLEESLAIARELDDRRSIALVLQPLGIAHHGLGELDIARGHFEEALAMARELGNRREIAAALIALAQVHRVEGRLDAAEPLYAEALALARDLGDREIVCVALLNLAMVIIGRTSASGVPPMLLEALVIANEIGARQLAQSVLDVAAGLAASLDDCKQAAQLYGAAETLSAETAFQRDRTDEAFLTPLMERARATLGGSGFESAVAEGRALDYDAAMEALKAWLTRCCG